MNRSNNLENPEPIKMGLLFYLMLCTAGICVILGHYAFIYWMLGLTTWMLSMYSTEWVAAGLTPIALIALGIIFRRAK